MNDKIKIILILLIVIVIGLAIGLKLKNNSSSKNENQISSENQLVKDPNIANFIDEETGYYIVYNQETGEEIARVKTKEEIYYYETHQNEEIEPKEITDEELNIENEL